MKDSAETATQKSVKNKNKKVAAITVVVCLGALAAAIFLSVTNGAADISYHKMIQAFTKFDSTDPQQLLLREMRIPRALAGALVGAALAVSGAIMQGMTRNPMADSGLMGLSAGAGLFLAVTYVFFKNMSYSQTVFLTFLGAAFGAGCVYFISSLVPGGNHALKLVLAGATISTLFSAISQAIALTANASQSIMFWTMGGVSGTSWKEIQIAAPVILIALCIACLLSRNISIMNMGEEMAKGIGVNTRFTRTVGMLMVVLLSGTSFALAGSITFVGIMIPHFSRFLVGPDYRWIIPVSALQGALLVVFADFLAKTMIKPSEIPLGAVIALVGVPVFLYYARKERGESI